MEIPFVSPALYLSLLSSSLSLPFPSLTFLYCIMAEDHALPLHIWRQHICPKLSERELARVACASRRLRLAAHDAPRPQPYNQPSYGPCPAHVLRVVGSESPGEHAEGEEGEPGAVWRVFGPESAVERTAEKWAHSDFPWRWTDILNTLSDGDNETAMGGERGERTATGPRQARPQAAQQQRAQHGHQAQPEAHFHLHPQPGGYHVQFNVHQHQANGVVNVQGAFADVHAQAMEQHRRLLQQHHAMHAQAQAAANVQAHVQVRGGGHINVVVQHGGPGRQARHAPDGAFGPQPAAGAQERGEPRPQQWTSSLLLEQAKVQRVSLVQGLRQMRAWPHVPFILDCTENDEVLRAVLLLAGRNRIRPWGLRCAAGMLDMILAAPDQGQSLLRGLQHLDIYRDGRAVPERDASDTDAAAVASVVAAARRLSTMCLTLAQMPRLDALRHLRRVELTVNNRSAIDVTSLCGVSELALRGFSEVRGLDALQEGDGHMSHLEIEPTTVDERELTNTLRATLSRSSETRKLETLVLRGEAPLPVQPDTLAHLRRLHLCGTVISDVSALSGISELRLDGLVHLRDVSPLRNVSPKKMFFV